MPTVAASALEELLGADFTDIRPLGEDGGLSRLFRAHKQSLDVDVVIKRMRMDPRRPADVQREARVMTSLRHQFLPRIFDFKTDGEGYCYTIMELIPGCTLRQYVQRQGALDQKQALHWAKQLLEAAAYMHSQRPAIIHSDIKPENIMITPQGDICLIDFNASLELRDDGVEAVGATMCYAAPEQYNVPLSKFGDPALLPPERRQIYEIAAAAQSMGKVTERTDLYAIGAVTYFMMTGYDPACWAQGVVPLERYSITLGDPFRQAIERCMSVESGQRFSSAKEALRALNGLAKMDKRYRDWRRQCQTAALVVGAGLILSAFALLWGFLLRGQETGAAYNALIQQAQQLREQQDQAGEQELLLQAIALDRERPEAYANLGALLYQQRDYQQAVELLDQVDPDQTGGLDQAEAAVAQGQIQYVLASCYYQLQDYTAALPCYQTAALFCAGEAAYQRDLAVCCARCGYMDLAGQALTALSGLDTLPGDTELVTGEIAYAAGAYEQALDQLRQAARLSESHTVISRASLQAAQCCRQLGDGWIREELDILETASRRLDTAENASHIQLLAEAWLRLAAADPSRRAEGYQQALTALEDLNSRGQPTFAVRQNLALVLEYLDRFQESEDVLLALRADFPQDYRPAMRLGLLYADWEGEKAQKDYSKVVEMYQEAQSLYTGTDLDSDMVRLEELVRQIAG